MLSDLPSETVSEIVSHLPYKDIFVLRQVFTCEAFHAATNAHVVWLNLAKQYLAENPHSHFSNLRSLSSLTTDQLRERFEKRLMVDDIWQLPGNVYPTVKRLRRLSSAMMFIKIAPGGRWLFASTDQRSIYYWDLDSDDPEPVLLIPCDGLDDIPGADNTVAAIDFLVERDDPLSGFTIAFIGVDAHLEEKSGEWLHIWDVVLQNSGVLIAKRLKTLPLPYNCPLPELSFNNHLVARAMDGRVDVYWWKQCTETRLVRCTLESEKRPMITNIYVVGNDKVLVFTGYQDHHRARLYALEPEYSDVNDFQKVAPHATKIWSFHFRCEYHGHEISRLSFDGANYCQIIAMLEGIYSLTIPALQADKATLIKVSDFNLHQQHIDARLYGLGLNKGYCRVDTELYRFGYSLDSTSGSYECAVTFDSRLTRLSYVLQNIDSDSSFDEELGRLISISRSRLILHDFSLPLFNLADVGTDIDRIKDEDVWQYTRPSLYG